MEPYLQKCVQEYCWEGAENNRFHEQEQELFHVQVQWVLGASL